MRCFAAAAEIVIVERGQIVVHERIRVDQLERGKRNEKRLGIRAARFRRSNGQDRPHAFACA